MPDTALYRFGAFELDLGLFELRSRAGAVTLTPRTFALLKYLVEHSDRVVTKEELLAEVWRDACVAPSSLPTHIKRLRNALGQSAKEESPIQTYHGRGYRLSVPVERVERGPRADRVEGRLAAAGRALPGMHGHGLV